MRPLVSLIIPVHNAEPFLDRCLNSAAAQTEPELEIICVDDASTDASPAMLDAWAAADSRFRIVHRPVNGGESAARNHGVALARGEYLAFLDHDDMLEPDACRLLYAAARESDADIVRGRVKTIDYEGQVSFSPPQWYKDISDVSRFYFNIEWWSAIYRASLVQGRLTFVEGYPLGGDVLFLAEALLASQRLLCIDDVVYTHFLLPDSGASILLSEDKVRSTIATRLRIIELLHAAHIDVEDKYGYIFQLWQWFENGMDMLYNRCMNKESRMLCCEYLYQVKDLHRYPEIFFTTLQGKAPYIAPLFIKNGKKFMMGIVQKYADLHSPVVTSALRLAGMRCAAESGLAVKKAK